MKPKNAVLLTKQEYESLKQKKINQGTDGSIYRVGGGLLYKIYHEKSPIGFKDVPVDEEGVKIFRKQDFQNLCLIKKDIPKSYTKLRSVDAILLAKEKQKFIHYTTLPLAPIYIENHFRGCVIKDYPYNKSIYFVKYFPFTYRLYVCKKLLMQMKELLNYNIYPRDLCGKPYNQSNVLLNFLSLGPVIIDTDGYSTIYTKEFVFEFYQECIESLNGLILEILYEYPIEEIVTPTIKLEKSTFLEEAGVPDRFIEPLVNQNMSLEDLSLFLNRTKRNI